VGVGEVRLFKAAVAATDTNALPDQPHEPVRDKCVCFGEALRAISQYSDLDIATPPSAETLELLHYAYDCLRETREKFSAEDFAVFAFALVLECCRSEVERNSVRMAASKYLIANSRNLADDFAKLAPSAHLMVARLTADKPPQPRTSGKLPAEEPRSMARAESDLSTLRRRSRRLQKNARAQRLLRSVLVLGVLTLLGTGVYLTAAQL